jgi:FixJ family two-component response regulator
MKSEIKPIVAVVDDDPRLRESLESLIESAGFTVKVFQLAEEFLKESFLVETNCLITDVRMPGMGGLELQCRVRLERPDLPVIFMTAHHDDGVQQRALAGGAACFIHKPFDAQDLLGAVRTALSRSCNNG